MKKNICILDYGSGNVGSVKNLLDHLNYNSQVSNDTNQIKNSTHIILPGVGAFGASMQKIKSKIPLDILEHEVLVKKKPFLGICVGMQVLLNKSFEFGEHNGLGWVEGTVNKLEAKILPHIGWNTIEVKKETPLFDGLGNSRDFYFVNSFAVNVKNKNYIIAETEYEKTFCSALQKDNIFGVQFHPEKSSKTGQSVIKNFIKI